MPSDGPEKGYRLCVQEAGNAESDVIAEIERYIVIRGRPVLTKLG